MTIFLLIVLSKNAFPLISEIIKIYLLYVNVIIFDNLFVYYYQLFKLNIYLNELIKEAYNRFYYKYYSINF